ncbi:unnamed protein product [Hymenolepis diminuta]|uniref:Single-stranded DNA-binding protein n=1 Tax=Hymenolepis diminuta TaxID=6216 RepID=A0A0R3SSG6_HYMDI|nr:unnamed protein product [Hymenolepis diminuta]VUZ52171.1 unnamed protein product [Hymenolepis diminuta]
MKIKSIVLTLLTYFVSLSLANYYYYYYYYHPHNFGSQYSPSQSFYYGPYKQNVKETLRATPMNIAVQYADATEMKNILLEAPVQEILCTLEPQVLYDLLSYLPNFSTGNDSPAQVRKVICEDKDFYARMKKIHPDTLKYMINALPYINFLFSKMDDSFLVRIVNSANKAALAEKGSSYLNDYSIVYHLYHDMPNINSYYASTLLDVNCGYITFVMEHHYNLEHLIPYMDSRALNHVIECYPQLGEKMVKFNGNILERILQDVYHLVPFLENLKDVTKRTYLLKVPRLATIMPKNQTHTEVRIAKTEIAKENLDYLRSKVPKVEMILNRLNNNQRIAVNSNMTKIKNVMDAMPSEDIKKINSEIEDCCDVWDKMGRETLLAALKIIKDDPVYIFFSLLL